MKGVPDASALLALLLDEPGAQRVEEAVAEGGRHEHGELGGGFLQVGGARRTSREGFWRG